MFDAWWYLRFLLPAYPMLLAGASAVLLRIGARAKSKIVSFIVIPLMVGAVAVYGAKLAGDRLAFDLKAGERKYLQAADYAQSLPRPAVLATLHHSGSLHYYTNHDILRWDFVDPAHIDSAIQYLRARGYHVYLFIDTLEMDQFRRRFQRRAILNEIDRGFPIELPGDVRVYWLGGTERPPLPDSGSWPPTRLLERDRR